MPQSLFIFAGEPSGDLHGSTLVQALKQSAPKLSINGVAGPRMRSEGISGPLTTEQFSVMGFSDVLKSLPKLCLHFLHVRNAILKDNPDGVVLIDFADFNLRMARALRKKGYQGKIIHYISPSVWAWGSHRIEQMAQTLDLLLTIYPFEPSCFARSTLPVAYVGSPVKEQIASHTYATDWRQQCGIPQSQPLVALFPGSRAGELKRNLPTILGAAALLKERHPEIVFGISCGDDIAQETIQKALVNFPSLSGSVFTVPRAYTYELMRDARCAAAKSGTVTLELAMHRCPTAVIYQLSSLNRLYAKYIVKPTLSHYCIVNILAKREVFPELITEEPTAEKLAHHLDQLFCDGDFRAATIAACESIDKQIGNRQASVKAAEAIMNRLNTPPNTPETRDDSKA